MNMKQKILPLLLLGGLLSGCGSDSDNDSNNPAPAPESVPKTGTGAFDNVWGPDVNFQLETPIYVYMESVNRADMIDQFQENKEPAGAIKVEPALVRAMLPVLWREDEWLRRPFNDNQITFADVLLYLSATKANFDVNYLWNENLSTYQYSVSYDQNGDGDFDDEQDHKDDPNWYASYLIDSGHFRREIYSSSRGEALYRRLELTHVQPNAGIVLRSHSQAMTTRREAVQLDQAERRRKSQAEHGPNTVVIPKVKIAPIGQAELEFHDVVVTPHNLRPDIYKKDGAITIADLLLSMDDQGLIDIGFTFWGTLGSDVSVQHFFLNEINGQKAYGLVGYLHDTGVSWAQGDFSAKYIPTFQPVGMGVMPSYCDWTGQDSPYGQLDEQGKPLQVADGKIDLDNPECDPETTDIRDWFTDKGYHFFSDVWSLDYPGDFVAVKNMSMYVLFAEEESQRVADDHQWPIYDTDEAEVPLTSTHFGWGIADCGSCHSLDEIHVEGDKGALGVNPTPVYIRDHVTSYPLSTGQEKVVAPYQCAQCHGSNGAPNGHGEVARCFWCHSEEFVPNNHGAISKHTTFGSLTSETQPGGNDPDIFISAGAAIDVPTTDAEAVAVIEQEYKDKYSDYLLPNSMPTAPINFNFLAPHDDVNWEGRWGFYKKDMPIRTNSDWYTDPTFPDPYSCVTCHKNR